ncbi:peptidase domain-containing ABC transporter [Segetibacter koreensis]|uniref:peptidase domain-containing ABC transporter n=1 Tax=Segetibacter koreensis TaxID=398037 RepID=UPI0003624927|nr:peptidase domain-containing ABC transporter [Segetibacter koreensis]
MRFPFTTQLGARDCGPACLKMMAEYYGQEYSLDYIKKKCEVTKVGVSLLGLSKAAEAIGLHCIGMKMHLEQLKEAGQEAPIILHWNENHFVVVYKLPKPNKRGTFYVADPARGLVTFGEKEFMESWLGRQRESDEAASVTEISPEQKGYALLLEPTSAFFNKGNTKQYDKKNELNSLWKYFVPQKNIFIKLLFIMIIGSLIMLCTPYFTRALVDKGINSHNLNFVYLILFGQVVLFIGNSITDILRSNLLLHMGSRINIAMVSDFLTKILKLPVSFFDKHVTGDLIQRIADHHKIENLLTVASLNTIFSFLNFVVLSIVLEVYSTLVFSIFISGSLLGFAWAFLFMRKRRSIDYKLFGYYSKENSKVIEIMTGIQDIKISNSMWHKRWEWQKIKSGLYKLKIKSLTLAQLQKIGSDIFKQGTTITITFITAKSVMDGNISLGTMFAITMIIGQLSSPLQQLQELLTSWQDAKMGMERICDVMKQEDEDTEERGLAEEIPDKGDVVLSNVTFGYGEQCEPVLKDISLRIFAGKITAIVGSSGSGKTTLMKLLLRFYDPINGSVSLSNRNFRDLHHGRWREKCGVVLQDSRLFSATIADNIAMGHEKNFEAIVKAAEIANIHEFIIGLPKGYMTEIGDEGVSLSSGQTQRIILARAIYKNPSYLFLDEATSALDANNEKTVIENLSEYFKGRTVVVVAHRLSTVKNADQLIVLEDGEIVERGSHLQLTHNKGAYYELVKNQLELGD